MPDNNKIPLEQIIELRGRSDFVNERKAYIKATKELIELREHGQIDYSMKEMLQTNRTIVRLLHQSLNIANDVIQIPLKIIHGVGIAPLIEGALSVVFFLLSVGVLELSLDSSFSSSLITLSFSSNKSISTSSFAEP